LKVARPGAGKEDAEAPAIWQGAGAGGCHGISFAGLLPAALAM
jgi:hypothetical protein